MQQKQEKQAIQEDTIRYKLLPLFRINAESSFIPLNAFEVVLEFIPYLLMLKFSIDYFTMQWLGYYQPIFTVLDPSYYLKFIDSGTSDIVTIVAILYMNIYWAVPVIRFLAGVKQTNFSMNIRKFIFIISKNILVVPFLNMTLNLFSCVYLSPFRQCTSSYPDYQISIAVISFSLFTLLILAQSFFNFDFLKHKKQFRRIKKSSFTPPAIIIFLISNQAATYFVPTITCMIILNVYSVLLVILYWIKDEQTSQRYKLIEISFISVNVLAIFMFDVIYFTNQEMSLLLFFFLSTFLVIGLMQMKTYSMKFELENINKWTTSQIMIRYTQTLRYYLSRRDQYIFKVYIHGYMEIHRQKCDSPSCPSRCELTDSQKRLFGEGKLKKQDEQCLRMENIVKKIYSDGLKITPISSELQLQYSIFLYELGQKEMALKNLLLIKFQELSYDKYYRYSYLKQKIHRQMCQQPNKNFLDLVSELQVKRQQQKILAKFQKAALINLQFWSILNEDHPDFQKLNEIGASRISIRKEVKQSYEKISSVAHSQKITSLYVHYLEAIENDETMYNQIYEIVKEQHDLKNKIVLQDWANSSSAIMLVSIDEVNNGNIIDINSSCASLFGYERYQILNRPLKTLFFDQLKHEIKDFLMPNCPNQLFYMVHKSGYVIKMRRKCQNYNSMQTGMASIITMNVQLLPNHCQFIVDKNMKIFGLTSNCISHIGVQLKTFEGDIKFNDFFNIAIDSSQQKNEWKEKSFSLQTILHEKYENQLPDHSKKPFKLDYEQRADYLIFILEVIAPKRKKLLTTKRIGQLQPVGFEFQIQATLTSFKYFGNFNNQQNYLSQFSQIQYAQSLKQGNTIRNYSQGIKTLRLKQNIIQVIEQEQEQQWMNLQRKNSDLTSQTQNLARKDEEQIFLSKNAYQNFIGKATSGTYITYLLFFILIGLLAIYINFYFIQISHHSTIQQYTAQISNQNLIIGAIAKEQSLLRQLELFSNGIVPDTVTRFMSVYSDNIVYLSNIKLLGSDPYQISVKIGTSYQNFLTDQFVLSFLNYAQNVFTSINKATTTLQLGTMYKSIQPYLTSYLLQNSKIVKQTMMAQVLIREQEIKASIQQFMDIEIIMFAGGVVFSILFTILIFLIISKINKERINLFQIFLDVSEIQIQQFSSKTEKFLLSLHVQDTNGEIDVDEQVENTKKINSSTFAKKKRFKQVNFNKSIYLKLLFIPIFATAFFVHSFICSYQDLSFQYQSYHYYHLTSLGDYKFFSGLSQIQEALLSNKTIPTTLSQQYILYYRDYFDLHFTTLGYNDDFHQTFTSTLMLDICKGKDTPLGNTKIKQSCQISTLSSNGSYLVFTDTTMRTQFFENSSSLSYQYLVNYEVLSKAHRLITKYLLKAQQGQIAKTTSSLQQILLIWSIVMGVISFIYGAPVLKGFISEINEIKHILSILPISLAKQLPLAPHYFNRIIKTSKCC